MGNSSKIISGGYIYRLPSNTILKNFAYMRMLYWHITCPIDQHSGGYIYQGNLKHPQMFIQYDSDYLKQFIMSQDTNVWITR